MGESLIIDRLLSFAGTDSPEAAESRVRSLRRLVLLTLAFESWVALGYIPYSSQPARYGAVAALLTLCAGVGWRDRFAWPVMAGAFLIELSSVLSVFPENANHQFLMLLFLGLLLLVGRSRDSIRSDSLDVACLQATRWIVAIGLFWAGFMKLWYGYWLEAEFLSFRIAIDPGFAWVFGAFISDSEMARLVALDARAGAGPFLAKAPLLVVISNLTWVAEILVGFGLLWSRTRTLSMVGALLLMVAIQLGAREVFFAGLMVGALLLYAKRDYLVAYVPAAGLFYLVWLLRPHWGEWLGLGANT